MVMEDKQWAEKAGRQAESVSNSSIESRTNEGKGVAEYANSFSLSPGDYWTALEANGKIPNWWMTRTYVEFAELQFFHDFNWNIHLSGWIDPDAQTEDGPIEWSFPPLGPNHIFFHRNTWAGLPGVPGTNILDRQYLYDAKAFKDLRGGRWQTFRKNVVKYPKRTTGRLVYRRLEKGEADDDIHRMLMEWSKRKGDEIYDAGTMVMFFFFSPLRWGLFRDGNLVGLNVADENWLHGIYRYCLDDGTPYLNEYMRWLFYTSEWAQEKEWINDGGDLDNDKLARFKMKLNPASIDLVYSHFRKG